MQLAQTAQPGSGLSLEQISLLKDRLHAERNRLMERLTTRRRALATPFVRESEDGDWASATVNQSLLVRLVDRDAKLLDRDRPGAREAGHWIVRHLRTIQRPHRLRPPERSTVGALRHGGEGVAGTGGSEGAGGGGAGGETRGMADLH